MLYEDYRKNKQLKLTRESCLSEYSYGWLRTHSESIFKERVRDDTELTVIHLKTLGCLGSDEDDQQESGVGA